MVDFRIDIRRLQWYPGSRSGAQTPTIRGSDSAAARAAENAGSSSETD
jgi:hypothetical protein